MKTNLFSNCITLKIFSIIGYILFFLSLYITIFIHSYYYNIDNMGNYVYKNISQMGEYEVIIFLYGIICLLIHLLLFISLLYELIIKKNYLDSKFQINTNILNILFFIGLFLNISPYIVSRFIEIIYNEVRLILNFIC